MFPSRHYKWQIFSPEEYISDNCLPVFYISLNFSFSFFSENIKKIWMILSQLTGGHWNAVYLREKGVKWSIFLLMLLDNQGSLVETGFHFKTNQPLHPLTFVHLLTEVEWFYDSKHLDTWSVVSVEASINSGDHSIQSL